MAQPTQALRALPLGLLLDQALPRGVAPVVGPPDEPPGLVAPAPAEDCMAPTPALDLAAVCAAYHAATGRDDLHLEADALRAVVQARPLTAAYVDAKIDLLRTAMDAGRVRSPRRFFVAALVQDWTPETAPRGAEPARAPDPGPAPPTEPRGDAATLADRLAQLGVAGPVAERLARDDPAAVAQQLAWLPYRRATDPAAVVVRAIREHWSEPPAAWSARTAEAQRREHERWAADMRRLEAESRTPAGRRLAHEGLAAMRRILGMPDRRSA